MKGASWDDIYPRQYADPVVWGWGSNAPVELFELALLHGQGQLRPATRTTRRTRTWTRRWPARTVEESYRLVPEAAQWDAATETGVAPEGDGAVGVARERGPLVLCEREGLKVAEQKPHPHGHGWSLVNNVDQLVLGVKTIVARRRTRALGSAQSLRQSSLVSKAT